MNAIVNFFRNLFNGHTVDTVVADFHRATGRLHSVATKLETKASQAFDDSRELSEMATDAAAEGNAHAAEANRARSVAQKISDLVA